MDYSAVLFDLDGTLLDTLTDLANAANAVLARQGFPTHPVADYRRFIGAGVETLFARALPNNVGDRDRIARCIGQFQEAYAVHWNVHTRPYPDVLELLATLQARQAKMAVLSNKPHPFTQRCVAEFLPAAKFELVLGQRRGVPRKPDPAGANEIAVALAIPAEQFIYVGDSAIDMQTARRAGMLPVGVTWGFQSRDQLKQHGAKILIEQPLELLDLYR
jgi:phosphoglycolate phosphatase